MFMFGMRPVKQNIKRIVALFLSLLMAFPMGFAVMSTEASAKIDESRMYALVVQTGDGEGGQNISYFVVEYIDNSGNTSRAYISPSESYKESREIANKAPVDQTIVTRVNLARLIGYTTDYESGADRTSGTPLSSNSRDTYFFNTYYPISSVTSVSVVVDGTHPGNTSWSCYGLDVYKVNKLSGNAPSGYLSNQREVSFDGTKLASIEYTNAPGDKSLAYTFRFNGPGKIKIGTSPSGTSSDEASIILKNSGFPPEASSDDTYMVKVDIADVYKAGLEEYMQEANKKLSIGEMSLAEPLVFSVTYKDNTGAVRKASAPVLVSAIVYAHQKKAISIGLSHLADLISQGGSLAFPIVLPGFSELLEGSLTYVDSAARLTELTGLKSTDGKESGQNAHYKAFANDDISISGVQIYKGEAIRLNANVNSDPIQLPVEAISAPVYYYVAGNVSGRSLSAGDTLDLDFSEYTSGEKYTAFDDRIENNRLFLLEVTTGYDDVVKANSDISLELKYFDISGQEKITPVDLKEDCKSYYGYWKSTTENVAYEEGIKKGNTLYALIETPEAVDYFSGVIFKNDGSTDWGASNFSIYRVRDLGKIQYKWRTSNTEKTNVDHYRVVNGVDLYSGKLGDTKDRMVSLGPEKKNGDADDKDKDGYIYVAPSGESRIDFNGVRISEVNTHDPNFFEHYYTMDYEYATKDHGFSLIETDYTVRVNVGSEPYSSARNDDCGSNNLFYFQLVFQGGKSAYVQANQQLESDGFRSAQTESFNIAVNRDYGEVTGVNIIPEMNEEIGSPYDKLKIDSIEVISPLGNGFSESYTIENVGWVGIESNQNATADKPDNKGQIAKQYLVNTKKAKANLLFTINHATCETRNKDGGYNQFQGKVYAVVRYTDADGNHRSSDRFDVINQMYIFDGKESLKIYDDKGGIISLPELMFRENSADRFLFEAEDVDRLEGIDFYLYNATENTIYWSVDSVGVSLIADADLKNNRSINSKDEYILKTENSPISIASSTKAKYSKQINPKAIGEKLSIQFTSVSGSSLANATKSTMPYIIAKEPLSENDTLNVYAFLSDNAPDEAHKFNVDGEVIFSDTYGYPRHSKFINMTATTAENVDGINQRVYQVKNLGAKQFGTMTGVKLSANGRASCQVPIDYVIVQRMRSNVIIETYLLTYTDGPYDIAMAGIPQTTVGVDGIKSKTDYQVVTLEFGNDTTTTKALSKAKYDVAVALNYKSTLGGDDTKYQTEFVNLTDMGITSLKPGDVVDFRFNEPNIGEITGITIASSSFLQADIKRASVGVYRSVGAKKTTEKTNNNSTSSEKEDEQEYEVKEWYSFNDSVFVKNQSKTIERTGVGQDSSSTVSPLTFTFKTRDYMDDYSSIGVASSDHVKMIINYTVNGNTRQYVADDIVKNIVSGTFGEGKEAVVRVLATGINYDTIKSVALIPYSKTEGKTVYWGLESININFGDGQKTHDERFIARSGGMIFAQDASEEDNTVRFSSARITATVYDNVNGEYADDFSWGDRLAIATPSKAATLKVDCKEGKVKCLGAKLDITNSSGGYTVECNDEEHITIWDNDDDFVFAIKNITEDVDDIEFKVTSKENPDSSAIINLKVKYVADSTPSTPSTP